MTPARDAEGPRRAGSARPAPASPDAAAQFIDDVLGGDSLEGSLALGLQTLARLSRAEVAAILPIEAGDSRLEIWVPNDPSVRERHRPSFLAASESARGNLAPAPRRPGAAGGEPPRVIPLITAGSTIGTLCLAGGDATHVNAALPLIPRMAAVLACLAAAHYEAARALATRREYERWFKILDEQIRVLERERQKFAAIVHGSDAEVFVTDRAGLIRWTNVLLASHAPPGPAGGCWIGQGCRSVCSRLSAEGPPECGDCPVARAVSGCEVVHHEFRRGNHAGARTLYLSAFPIKGPDGQAHEVLVMVQDLSDLGVLRRSESRYRLLFERSAKAILMVDPETRRIMMANPMASRMTGYSAEELCALTLDALHSSAEWSHLDEGYRAGFPEGNLAAFEARIRTRDGGEVEASVTGTHYDVDDQDVEMLEFQDVGESRRVEEALRNAEERLRSVVANAPVILFAIDENGTFTLSEGQGLASLGLSPGQIVGCSVYELYQDHPRILANVRRAMAGEEFTERVDVGEISLETWYKPTFAADGRPLGIIGVSNDVTQRRRLEDQLRQAQKMEAIGRLAGGVAHDFNNLLAAIMGHGELLLRRLDASHPQHRHAEAIQKAATRGALLTRQLLAFSRKEVLTPRVLDLHLVVAEMEEMLRRLIGEHIELIIVLGDRPVQVRADRGQLEQVIMNLAVNARDAMTDGGVLTVEVATVGADPQAAPGTPRAGSCVTVAVTDTGCGMDAMTAARIFEPFFTTKEQGKGTGLGLSTVYGIVEQSGGVVEIASTPGKGSTFTVVLPRLEQGVGSPRPEAAAPMSVRGTETVLLAEDEPAVRAVAREALQDHGYHVLEAANGVEALRIAREHQGPVHLLVTDMVMPQMGGRELAHRLAAIRPTTPVLFMSGHTDDAYVRQGASEATSAFLHKPFAIAALARKVRETLDAAPAQAGDDAEPHARAA